MSVLNITPEQYNLPVGQIAKTIFVDMHTQQTTIGGGHDYGRHWDHDAEKSRCEIKVQEAIKHMTDLSTKSLKDVFQQIFNCKPCFRKVKMEDRVIFRSHPSAGETTVMIPTELDDLVIVNVTIYIYF